MASSTPRNLRLLLSACSVFTTYGDKDDTDQPTEQVDTDTEADADTDTDSDADSGTTVA